jgi:hypothetical protein
MATATAAEKAIGFRVPCPHCGAVADDEGDVGLGVRLSDLSVRCSNCDEEVIRADLARPIDDVQRLLRWLDAAAAV